MNSRNQLIALALASVTTAAGCASTAPPFDTMAASQVTAYRLQNYEPPAAAAAAVPGATGASLIPGLPPEITSWVTQATQGAQGGLAGLQGLIPPGLIPGLGGAAPAAATPAVDTSARFHGFRILGTAPVSDSGTRSDLAKLLGDPSSFDDKGSNCLYAEMGISFSTGPTPNPNDILLSFSCHNVAAYNFNWPHPNRGITPATSEKLAVMVQKIFQFN